MKLNAQQSDQLMFMCQWILDYDQDLPNSDGDRTDEVVRMAHKFSRFIDNYDLISEHEGES